MKHALMAFFALSLFFSACNNSSQTATKSSTTTDKNKDGKEEKEENEKKENKKEESEIQILNDISITTEGDVEVYRTFLSYEDGSLVPSSNTTSLGKPIYLNINITKGWHEENGEVSLGASERISTDNGTVFLDAGDLFKNRNSLNAEDAKFIRLKAVVNSMTGPINYFVVDYKVWDKKGNGEIKGSYKFYIE